MTITYKATKAYITIYLEFLFFFAVLQFCSFAVLCVSLSLSKLCVKKKIETIQYWSFPPWDESLRYIRRLAVILNSAVCGRVAFCYEGEVLQ